MKRLPALKAALIFAAGVVAAYWLNPSALPLLILLPIILALTFLLRRFQLSDFLISFAILVSGTLAYETSLPSQLKAARVAAVRCIVDEPPVFRENKVSFPGRLEALGTDTANLLAAQGRVWITGYLKQPPIMGRTVVVTGVLQPEAEVSNPGGFDLRRYRLTDGYIGRLHFEQPGDLIVINKAPPLRHRLRSYLGDACDRLARWDAPLWKGLLLGFRRDIDPTLMEELRVTGLTHLLALSGLNVGFLAAALIGLSSVLRLPPSRRAIPALLLVVVYSFIIPDRGATVRASIMVIAVMLGTIIYRWTPALNGLGIAGLFTLAYRPGDLFDPGFQMSFAATAGILLFNSDMISLTHVGPRTGKFKRRLKHWILAPFLISLASSIAVAPLTAYHFFSVPIAGPIFNLIAVPLLGVVYAGAWLSVLIMPVWGGLAELIADGVLMVGALWGWFTHQMAQIAPVWEGFLAPLALVGIFVLLIWAATSKRSLRYRALLVLGGVYLLFVLGSLQQTPDRFRALFLDVGHGDAQVWLSPAGRTAVIDAGPDVSGPGRGIMRTTLRRLNIGQVDLLTASHLEADHIGGLSEIVEHFPVQSAFYGGRESQTETTKRLFAASEKHRLKWQYPSAGSVLNGLSSGCEVEILNPSADISRLSANDASLVMRLQTKTPEGGTATLLTTGDIQAVGESTLIHGGKIRSDLLKVPHHGSITSSSDDFVTAVAPKDVVISRAGAGERGSQASYETVLGRYHKVGAAIHQTGLCGAVLFEAAGDGWRTVDWRHPSFCRWLLGRM